MIKQRKKRWNMLRWKEKSYTVKTNNTSRGNKSEGNGERKKAKMIRKQDKIIQTKKDIPKQRKNNFTCKKREKARRCTNNRKKMTQNIYGAKYGNEENITKKLNRSTTKKKELEGLEEGPKAKIDFTHSEQHQKMPNWKTPGHDGIHGYWFKKIHFHPRWTGYRNE